MYFLGDEKEMSWFICQEEFNPLQTRSQKMEFLESHVTWHGVCSRIRTLHKDVDHT